uniref:EF-hand domain-containing protein n=1 Tax=Amphimedon queenslandica TaxID=400682 RepID=A0A1X7VX37_AMPQE
MILRHASLSEQKKKQMVGPKPNPGGNFGDVKFFNHLMGCFSDIDTALSMCSAAGISITPDDGKLSRKEFVHALKSRNLRGLQKSRELGLAKLMNSVVACKAVKDKLEKRIEA